MTRLIRREGTLTSHLGKTSLSLLTAAFLAGGLAMTAARSSAAAEAPPVDPMDYADDAAARAVWQSMFGTAAVSVARAPDGAKALKMPCNFNGTRIERACWDHPLKLDLSDATCVQFDAACDDPAPVAEFSFYLHSGDGWYSGHFAAASAGFARVTVVKSEMEIEGKPAGWAKIDALRISAWRGLDRDTALSIRNLRAIRGGGPIAVIRAESAALTARGEWHGAMQFTASLSRRLEELGLDYTLLSDLDLTPERLAGKRLVILPFSPNTPEAGVAALEKFLAGGGKMLAFYTLPGPLQQAAGLRLGHHVSGEGRFSSIRPAAGGSLLGIPPVVKQASWNIVECQPVAGRSKVVAEWYDSGGKPTGDAAIVASDNCVMMTHVMLDDDPPGKRRLLMAMVGAMAPDLWPTAARASLDRALIAGEHKDLSELQRLAAQAADEPTRAAFQAALAARGRALELVAQGQSIAAMDLAEQTHQQVVRGWCLLELPASGERRAFWCHNAFGVQGMDWDAAIKNLADNGFTAVQPNMLWGDTAFYNSSVLPVSPLVKEKGDQIALCLAACRKYGLQCHVWKVNWRMRDLGDFAARMKQEGRTQVGPDGKPIEGGLWLCPSHPANQKLETDAMVEVATRYDVDGIHFDYIRYPGPAGCFCAGCRERFEKSIGRKVARWPADVQDGPLREQWLDFRRDNITAVVAAVSREVRKVKPNVKISAAVFSNWPADRDNVGQDWKLWCERGYLDFVCPMDYTSDSAEFQGLVQRQMQWAGKAGCYPGIGFSTWGPQADIFNLFRMIQITREARTGGFTIFNYGPAEAREIVPLCGLGISRKDQ
jgi:uncharacterized lipoprotein YddW (UPF0748 family)